jgi:hypothetical protein
VLRIIGLVVTQPVPHRGACRVAPLRVYLHGTPRQWNDPLRPWIGQEAARCRTVRNPFSKHQASAWSYLGYDLRLAKHSTFGLPEHTPLSFAAHAFQVLAAAGVDVVEAKYLEGETQSVLMHFRAIEEFRPDGWTWGAV